MISPNGKITLQTRVVASSRQISCDLANEAVILSLEDGVYYGLNPVASRVWVLVQQPQTIHEIREVLLSEFEIEESVCTRDLIDLFGQLKQRGLIEVMTNGSSSH